MFFDWSIISRVKCIMMSTEFQSGFTSEDIVRFRILEHLAKALSDDNWGKGVKWPTDA